MTRNLQCCLCGSKIEHVDICLCSDCQKEIKEVYEEIFSRQPTPNRSLDQFAMDFRSVLSQLAFMKEPLKGKVISFFGGYDGTGLLSMFFGAKSMILWDIDLKVLDWWEQTAIEYKFDVSTVHYDVREPITNKLIEPLKSYTIGTWRTDPPYNCAGMLCFLSRIFYLNKDRAPLFLQIPSGNRWSQILKWNVREFLEKSGMKITDVSPDLCYYPDIEGADSCTWKIEEDVAKSLIPNTKFMYDIYRPTTEFAKSRLGCNQYNRCRAWRLEWNREH